MKGLPVGWKLSGFEHCTVPDLNTIKGYARLFLTSFLSLLVLTLGQPTCFSNF